MSLKKLTESENARWLAASVALCRRDTWEWWLNPMTGQIFNRWNQLIKGTPRNNGYLYIATDHYGFELNISYALAAWVMYHGRIPDPRLEIDHINNDKLDNRPCNLRLVSHIDNINNPVTKYYQTGERNCRSKITDKQRNEIYLLRTSNTCTSNQLAEMYHLSKRQVNKIVQERRDAEAKAKVPETTVELQPEDSTKQIPAGQVELNGF